MSFFFSGCDLLELNCRGDLITADPVFDLIDVTSPSEGPAAGPMCVSVLPRVAGLNICS